MYSSTKFTTKFGMVEAWVEAWVEACTKFSTCTTEVVLVQLYGWRRGMGMGGASGGAWGGGSEECTRPYFGLGTTSGHGRTLDWGTT